MLVTHGPEGGGRKSKRKRPAEMSSLNFETRVSGRKVCGKNIPPCYHPRCFPLNCLHDDIYEVVPSYA
jgi:hypothetical protein